MDSYVNIWIYVAQVVKDNKEIQIATLKIYLKIFFLIILIKKYMKRVLTK